MGWGVRRASWTGPWEHGGLGAGWQRWDQGKDHWDSVGMQEGQEPFQGTRWQQRH